MATGEATGKRAVSGAVTIRKCEALEEMRACFALQKEVWNFTDAELVPIRIFVLAAKIGGQVIGAFDRKELVSFALAIPGMRNGYPFIYSHMLAVRQQYRNGGLGRRMKLFQRDDALARGFELMEWTFDPLEIKNAYFNMERLGAIVRRFVPNQYGMTTSHLHAGLPTDRLVAEWWVGSERVNATIDGRPFQRPLPEARVAVPANIAQLRADHLERARKIQAGIGEQFQEYFRRGLAVIGFERTAEAGVYLIGKWESS